MPGLKTSEANRKVVDAKLICTVCSLLLSVPMQTPCGHLMCYLCVQKLLRNPNPRCPLDGNELTKDKVFFDMLKRRELNELTGELSCQNEGCRCSGIYKDLQEVKCCSTHFTPIEREQTQTQLRNNDDNQAHEEGGRTLQYLRDSLFHVCPFVVGCCLPIINAVRTVQGLIMKLENFLRRVVTLERRITNLEMSNSRSVEGNEESDGKIRRMETELREKDLLIVRMLERLDRMEALMAETTAKLCAIGEPGSEGRKTTSFNGVLLWRIDDFTQKRRDAVSGAQTAIYSPAFYSSQFGYKMCARIYMNGDGFGKETHISLFFVVMKGDYDALLPWPFQKKITMMMLDQSNGDHMVDAFRSDPESSSFQRPQNNMNITSGSPLFMPLDGLNNRAYVKDDTIFIKIIVD